MEVGKFLKKKLDMLKGRFDGTLDGNVEKIMKRVDSGKDATINKPNSQMTFTRGDDGHFASGQMLIGDEQKNFEGSKVESVPSTAIQNVAYDPANEVASIKFVDGEKTYDYSVTPEEFNDFLNAPSKGRWVSKVWNRNPRFSIY